VWQVAKRLPEFVILPSGGRGVGLPHPTKLNGDFAVGEDGALAWSDGDGVVQLCRPGNPPETIVPPTDWTRSARVALSPSGQLMAMHTGGDEVVVLQVAGHKEVQRWKLPGGGGFGWEERQGGLVFVSPTTIAVAHGRSGMLRKLEL